MCVCVGEYSVLCAVVKLSFLQICRKEGGGGGGGVRLHTVSVNDTLFSLTFLNITVVINPGCCSGLSEPREAGPSSALTFRL